MRRCWVGQRAQQALTEHAQVVEALLLARLVLLGRLALLAVPVLLHHNALVQVREQQVDERHAAQLRRARHTFMRTGGQT